MRQIGTLPTEPEARRFADYLLSLGMTTRLDAGPEGVAIWVREEDQVARATEELAAFSAQPADPRYAAAAKEAEALRREAVRKERAYRKNFVEVRDRWDTRGVAGRPLTLALVAISVVVYLIAPLGPPLEPLENALLFASEHEVDGSTVIYPWLDLERGQVWRLITPIFLHGGFLHLLFNMLWMIDLGGQIERRRGTWRFAVIVLVVAAVSNTAEFLWQIRTSPGGFGGMSGVVYGLFGYIWMKVRFDNSAGFWLTPNTVFMMILWFVVCAFNLVGPVANMAHGAGLLCGMAIGISRFAWRQLFRRN